MINVIEYKNIYHTGKWWFAVVLGEQFGRRKVFLYLWCKDSATQKWKRKQKTTVPEKNWNEIDATVRAFLPKTGGVPQSPQAP